MSKDSKIEQISLPFNVIRPPPSYLRFLLAPKEN